jgi:hypothetical protein
MNELARPLIGAAIFFQLFVLERCYAFTFFQTPFSSFQL